MTLLLVCVPIERAVVVLDGSVDAPCKYCSARCWVTPEAIGELQEGAEVACMPCFFARCCAGPEDAISEQMLAEAEECFGRPVSRTEMFELLRGRFGPVRH